MWVSWFFCQLLFTRQQSWLKVPYLFVGYLELSINLFVSINCSYIFSKSRLFVLPAHSICATFNP